MDKLYFCTMQFRKNSKYSNKALRRLMSALVVLGIFYSCASIGRLEGGPIDEDPPRFVASAPLPGELNSKRSKVTIEFDEFIKLDKPSEKIVVSPPQVQQPVIKSNGKKVTVTLQDSMRANTT